MTGISRQAMGLGLCPVLVAVSTLGCARLALSFQVR